MYTLLLFVLQLPLGILQTTVLSNLPSTIRYVVLAIAAASTAALSIYALAPTTTLTICDRTRDAALHRLSRIESESHSIIENALSAEAAGRPGTANRVDIEDIRERLAALDMKKARIEQVVWGQFRSHAMRTILSLPYLCAALRLLYGYFSLRQDIEVIACRQWQLSVQSMPSVHPEPQSDAAFIASSPEEHEMHSLDSV